MLLSPSGFRRALTESWQVASRRQGYRLSAAGWTGDQDKPSWLENKLFINLWQSQFINGWDVKWYEPEGKALDN